MTELLNRPGITPRGRSKTSARKLSLRNVDVHRAAWKRSYSLGLQVTDLIVLLVTVGIAQVWKFGVDSGATANAPFHLEYGSLGVVIVVGWMVALSLMRSRDQRILGEGPDEYRRVVRASVLLFGWVAIASLMLKTDLSRVYLAITFPIGVFALVLSRKLWRLWLQAQRRRGTHASKVLIIGGIRSAQDLAMTFAKSPGAGYKVTGAWVPDRVTSTNEWLTVPDQFIPVMGNTRSLAGALKITDADTVIVTDSEHFGQEGVRDLMWELEGVDIDLLMSPNVLDIASSRIHLTTVGGTPLLHLEEPQYAEAGSWPKAAFDKVGAAFILMALSPIFIAAAIAVKLTSSGPIFFRQSRGGINGDSFQMIKFRSMRVGAEQEMAAMVAQFGGGDKPLFKVANDPRITSAGRFLRRYSIDELPQLINVLKGEMSLVGPRPPLMSEVEMYDHRAIRRLHVRPGMTGLWQVSGRSDLEWDEAIKLDTYYVENWSMTGDLLILWRTVRAVFGSDGAY